MPWLTHHRASRLCRVVCGRDSQETAAQSSVFFSAGRVRRASARESSCQTPEVGRQRVAGGSGVTLSLTVGNRPRETKGGAKQRDLTVSPVTKTQRQTHSTTRERTCAPDAQHERRRTGCARACATARHTHVVSLTRFFTHSLTHSLSDALTHSHRARRETRSVHTSAPCDRAHSCVALSRNCVLWPVR